MSRHARINLILLGVVMLFGTALFALWPLAFEDTPSATAAASPFCSNLSPHLSLTGDAAYAMDLKSGKVLYQKNADTRMPLASLTKLMTALTASETLGGDDIVTISKAALAPEGDSGLQIGEEWFAKDLIDFTLVTSSNDGAHALALAAQEKIGGTPEGFIARMNAKAVTLGMTQTFFTDDTGLDISENSASAFGSARDAGTLFAYIAKTKPRLIERTTVASDTFVSLSGISHRGTNTSAVISRLPGAIGSKTGFTDLAGGNLGVIFEPLPGRPVVAVVLGSTREGRDADMRILAPALKTSLRRELICSTGL